MRRSGFHTVSQRNLRRLTPELPPSPAYVTTRSKATIWPRIGRLRQSEQSAACRPSYSPAHRGAPEAPAMEQTSMPVSPINTRRYAWRGRSPRPISPSRTRFMIEVPPETLLHDINRLLTLKCRNLPELVFQTFRCEEIQAQRQCRFLAHSYAHATGPYPCRLAGPAFSVRP
jgi:hypothetical protein